MNPQKSIPNFLTIHPKPACPLCGEKEVITYWDSFTFDYGSGESATKLTAEVPVRRCETCDFDYLDENAERLKHEAVCQHLKVLSPAEIQRVREEYGMTRVRFARVTGLGEASLHRWENGLSVQTYANDRYLRLLTHKDNMRRLEMLENSGARSETTLWSKNCFRALNVTDRKLKEKESFRLRKAA